MSEEKKDPPPPTALPPPKHWRPEMVARLFLSQADRYKWVYMIGQTVDGGLSIVASDLPVGAMADVLRVAVQEASKIK